MFCPYCGHKISDGARFCGNCGKKVAVSAQTTPTRKLHQKRWKGIHFSKKVAGGIVAAVLTAGIAFAGYTVMDDYFSKEQQVLLVSSERNCEVVTIDSKGNVRKRAILGTSDDADAARISNFDDIKYSEDKKYLYYRTCVDDSDGGTLYRAELSKLKDTPAKNNNYIKKIGENVTADYKFVQQEGIVYRDSSERLYYYKDEQTTFLAKNVTSFQTDGEDRLVYRNEDGVLRSVSLKDPQKHTTIAENAGHMILFSDVDHIVYSFDLWTRPSEIYITGYGKKASHPTEFDVWDNADAIGVGPGYVRYLFSSNSTDDSTKSRSIIQFDEQGITTVLDKYEGYVTFYDSYREKYYRMKLESWKNIQSKTNAVGGSIVGSWLYLRVSDESSIVMVPFEIEDNDLIVVGEQDIIELKNVETVGISENSLYYVKNYTDDYVADFYVFEDGAEHCIANQIDVTSIRVYEDGTVLYYNENPTFLMRMTPDGTKIAYERELDSCEFMIDGAFLYSTSDGALYWEKDNEKKRIAEGAGITVHGDAIQKPILDTSRYYF